jgi:tight adherence protein B
VVNGPVGTLLLALLAGTGAYLWATSALLGWRGFGPRLRGSGQRVARRRTPSEVLAQAGLEGVRPAQFLAVSAAMGFVLGLCAWALFAGLPVAVTVGVVGALTPGAMARRRRARRREQARDAWPRLLEELRLQVVSVGRSVPQALIEVGERAPADLRPAFAASAREWQRSTDLDRSLDVLKAQLADPAADAVCETLLVAHEVGGRDVDRRLRELVEDRTIDVQQRRDARAKQAGARFARGFVLVVPVGMALVGLAIGDGRAAYATAGAQTLVLCALAGVAACWIWAGRLLRLPEPDRVFVAVGERSPSSVGPGGSPASLRRDGRPRDGRPRDGLRPTGGRR